MMRRWIGTVALLAGAVACSSSSAPHSPTPVPTDQLHVVVQDSTAPPLYSDSVSQLFTAGQSGDVRLYYANVTGGSGEEFLRLEIPGDGLFRKPDGAAFQPGDTIRISIRVIDPKKMVFEFQPAGLQFNPTDPARLKIEYLHSDHDYNEDGVVNAADSTIQAQLDVWKNDPPSMLWYKQGAVNFESLEEIDVNVTSFSQYAVAW